MSLEGGHGFHMSHCNINYKMEEQRLQISLSLVIDDLEQGLTERGVPKLYLFEQKENDQADAYLMQYFEENFQLQMDQKKVAYQWVGKEIDDDLEGMWVYLEVVDLAAFTKLQITNKILMDHLDDQKNIVSIQGTEDLKGYFLFQKGDVVKTLNLE